MKRKSRSSPFPSPPSKRRKVASNQQDEYSSWSTSDELIYSGSSSSEQVIIDSRVPSISSSSDSDEAAQTTLYNTAELKKINDFSDSDDNDFFGFSSESSPMSISRDHCSYIIQLSYVLWTIILPNAFKQFSNVQNYELSCCGKTYAQHYKMIADVEELTILALGDALFPLTALVGRRSLKKAGNTTIMQDYLLFTVARIGASRLTLWLITRAIVMPVAWKGVLVCSCEFGHKKIALLAKSKLQQVYGTQQRYLGAIAHAVWKACANGQVEMVKWLFSTTFLVSLKKSDFREQFIAKTLQQACCSGNVALVKWVTAFIELSFGKISHQSQRKLMLKACVESVSLTEWVCSHFHLSSFSTLVSRRFHLACGRGNLQTAKWIKRKGSGSYNYQKSLIKASKNGHLNVVQWLCSKHHFSQTEAVMAVNESLIPHLHVNVAQWLISEYSLSAADLQHVLKQSLHLHFLDVTDFLITTFNLRERFSTENWLSTF